MWLHWRPPGSNALPHQSWIGHPGAVLGPYAPSLQELTLGPQFPAAAKQLTKAVVRPTMQKRVLRISGPGQVAIEI